MKTFIKDPNSILDYGFDWSDWLDTDDTVSTSAWTVPSGITEHSDSKTTTTTTIWLSGGTIGRQYRIQNRIVTADGRTADRSFYVKIENR